jgi:hypothetical protein
VATETSDDRVTADDIRAKIHEIEGAVQETAKEKAPIGVAVGVAVLVALVVVTYALGRRRGRRRSTIVEIRRI